MTQLADTEDAQHEQAGAGPAPIRQTVVVGPAAPAERGQPARPRSVSTRTLDDWVMLAGSGIGSLCLVWLLYTQVLPFSGTVGFFVCWFLVFVGLYAGATALTHSVPVVIDRIVSAVVQGGAAIVAAAVIWTLIYTFKRGFPAYRHWNFFSHSMAGVGPEQSLTHGGILHALVGTLWELGIAVAISLPLGVATAVFLCEIGGRFARVVRTVVEAMTALPDLIAGLFVYAFLILQLGQDRTGFSAAVALAVTMLPIIARSSEVVLRVVPGGLREASLALGASQWRTTWNVVVPTARSGLATALILGMARGIGESAPLLIVANSNTFFNGNPLHNPMNSLALFAITDLKAPDDTTITRGYGAASVLLLLVVILFVIVRLLARERGGKR